MDQEHGNGVNKKQVRFEVTEDELIPVTDKRGSVSSSSSSSSCSSSNSLEDLITIEDEFLSRSPSESKQPGFDVPPQQTSSFPGDHKMGQLAGYGPSRIPSSVFSSKPATPTDWSVASNESLFSLHMGNTSFSREQVFLMYKSGELPKLDDSSSVLAGLPSVSEVQEARKSGFSEKDLLPKETPTGNGSLVAQAPTEGDALGKKSAPEINGGNSACNSMSPHSDGSLHSTKSFAFPVLSDDLGRNTTVKLDQSTRKSPKKQHQQGHEEFQHQSPRKPYNACFGKGWLPRCSCFSLPCK